MSFARSYKNSDVMLTEGAIVERLKSQFRLTLDPFVNHAGLIYDAPELLSHLYKEIFEQMAAEMVYLVKRYHLKIVGGCCGTNGKFIEKLANNLLNR